MNCVYVLINIKFHNSVLILGSVLSMDIITSFCQIFWRTLYHMIIGLVD